MPSPSQTVTLRPDLSGPFAEIELSMDRHNFIGAHCLCPTQVAVNSGQFATIPIEQLLQDHTTDRAPGGGYNRGDFQFETVSFKTKEHGFEVPLDDREQKIYVDLFDAEQHCTQKAVDAVARAFERESSSLLFNPSTFASMTAGVTNEWDDAGNADPIGDVEAAVQAIWVASGLWPNALIINRKVFRNLRNCDEIVDRISSSGAGDKSTAGMVTTQQLAECFDLEHVLVGGSPHNSGNEGQDVSLAPIWSDEYAMVCRVATTSDVKEPCVARCFCWQDESEQSRDGEVGYIIESYRSETDRSTIYRCRTDWDQQIVMANAGYLLSNITT